MADKDKFESIGDGIGKIIINGKSFNDYDKAKAYLIEISWPEFDALAYIGSLIANTRKGI